MLGSYLKRGANNTIFYALSSGIVRVISFVLLPYFLSKLTLAEFGVLDFYQSFFAMGVMMLSSCGSTALVRFYLMYQDDEIRKRQAIGNALLFALTVVALFPIIAFFTLASVNNPFFTITIVNICLFALFSIILAYLRGHEKLVKYMVFFCGQNLLAILFTLGGVFYGFGVSSFFYANALSLVIFSPFFIYLFFSYLSYSWIIFKQQILYSLPLLFHSLLFTSFFTVDRFFIKYYSGYETLGLYSLLWRFGSILQFITIALMDAWPIVAFNAQKEKNGDFLLSRLTTYLCALLTTLSLGIIACSSCAIGLFFPVKYQVIVTYIPLFFVFVLLLEASKVFTAGFILSAKTMYTPLLTGVALGIQTLLFFFINDYGLWGFLVINSCALIMLSVMYYSVGCYVYSPNIFNVSRVIKIAGCFFVYAAMSQIFLLVKAPWHYWIFLLMSWLPALWVFVGIEDDEKQGLFNILRGLLAKVGAFNNNGNGGNMNTILYLRTNIDFKEITAGGSVAHTLGVINGFKEMGYQVLCASSSMQTTLQALDLDYFQELKLWPIFIFLRWKLAHLRWRLECFFANLFFTVQLLKVIKKHPLQFVYQRYSLLNCVGLIVSKLKGVPLILEYNGSEVWAFDVWSEHRWFKFTRLSKALEQLNVQYADFIVVVSQPLKDDLVSKGIEPTKILVNPNGVDPAMFNPETLENTRNQMRRELGMEDNFVFGFVGTFSYWHGIEVLAHIIPLLAQKNKRVHFLLIGDGPLKNYIVEAVTKAGVMSHVTFTGLVPQHAAKNYLAACDAFLCPTQPNKDGTRFFGSPTKVFEYMSMGKPIIASDLEQLHEVLSEECGILVEAQNFNGFFEAAQKLLELDAERIKNMGTQARAKVVAHYSWKKHVENIQLFVNRER